MPVSTPEEFLDLLEKSELLESEQLKEARAALRDGDDAVKFATRLVEAGFITDWQAAQMVAGRSSFYLGNYKYRLLDLLGQGGMGGVFLAEHTAMNRRVALKTISQNISKEPGSLERFLGEARVIASLDHPNIVQAYSVDNEGERFFLVMEYIDGQDLEQMVRAEGPLDVNTAADFVRQTAEGLEHGHNRGIIHCDIKPSNLLVNQSGVAKIVDMGLSRLEDPDGKNIQDKKDQGVLGSVDYLAPEQALGTDFNHRADIYSLGCTLYFLLTGRPPFPEGALHERLMKHQTVDPEPIAKFRTDVPDDLIEICGRMMAKEPDERYQSAREISVALAKYPAPKRRAKPAAPKKASHLIRAQAMPEPGAPVAVDGLPIIDTGDSGLRRGSSGAGKSGSGVGRKRAAPASSSSIHPAAAGKGSSASGKPLVAAGVGFLTTTRGKVLAAVAAGGGGLLLLLAILISFLIGSPKPQEPSPPEDDSWVRIDADRPATPATPSSSPSSPKSDVLQPVSAPKAANSPGNTASGPFNLVFDFETGDLQGWRIARGEFGEKLVNNRDSYQDKRGAGKGKEFGKQGTYFLDTSANGFGKLTGNIESPVFVVEGPTIRLLVGGGTQNNVGVKLQPFRGNKTLRHAKGPAGRFFKEVTWDVQDLIGKQVFIRVQDGNQRSTVLLDNVRIQGRIDEKGTEKRFAKLEPTDGQAVAATEPPSKTESIAGGKEEPDKQDGTETLAPKPKNVNPFKNLGKTGRLAMPGRGGKSPGEPHLLGELVVAPDSDVNLDLLGGSIAAPRGRTYRMQYDDANKSWLIYVDTKAVGGREPVRTDLARIAVRDQKLMFLWLKNATSQKAGYLLNCALDVRVDSASRLLPLAAPQQIKPLVLNLQSPESRVPLPSGRLPAPELLRLQVTGVEGSLPKPKFEPSDTISATEELKIVLESEGLPKVWFQLKLETRARAVSVAAAARFQVTGGPETKFTREDAQQLVHKLTMQGQIVEKETKTAKSKRAKTELGKQLEGIKTAVGQLGKLGQFYETVNRKGKIHFRVFMMIDSEHELTLMQTGESESGK